MTKESRQTAPGEGERRAMRGYTQQYDCAAAAVYAALANDELRWVGVADRGAGILDDIVLGFEDRVVGHQFKHSRFPESFSLDTILLGANGLLLALAQAWQLLQRQFPGTPIEVRLVTNDYPSVKDKLAPGDDGHSAAFIREFAQAQGFSLDAYLGTKWEPFINRLVAGSALSPSDFEKFFDGFRILCGPAANFSLANCLPQQAQGQVRQIANILPRLVADDRDQDRWSRAEILAELGWPDSLTLRRNHQFPVGTHVQRNWATEEKLKQTLKEAESGYAALIGPPGTGKSTLLQSSLMSEHGTVILRYLAFVPGEGQGIGRGEAESFLDDINTQLKRSGLPALRHHDSSLYERREQFAHLLREAGRRYREERRRTLIVVDGLDHIPREEHPDRSLLTELPTPQAVPNGVLFILGTQRLDLKDILSAVREQASVAERCIEMAPLPAQAVYRMMDALGLPAAISRERVLEICRGQPLVTRYLIEALRDADEARRKAILDEAFAFDGDIETVYSSAWREISDDPDARAVLQYIAHAEGVISPELLAEATSEGAVERALRATKHLLKISPQGWGVFHNSFRLYVLAKPELRFGRPDPTHSAKIYRKLADLAGSPSAEKPQKWLELRYRARAEDYEAVLLLAQPARFRHQLADGRSADDIQADIRLAFAAAKKLGTEVDAFRLLLASDEIERRSTALGFAPNLPEAMLALGEAESAEAAAERSDGYGYEFIQALLSRGEIEKARQHFDEIDPVEEILSGQQYNYDRDLLSGWAKCVFHFRDEAYILEAIKLLSTWAAEHSLIQDPASHAGDLKLEVAIGVVRALDGADPIQVGRAFEIPEAEHTYLLIEAAAREHRNGSRETAAAFILSAANHPGFVDVINGWRRKLALLAARIGQIDQAREIYRGLVAPTFDELKDDHYSGAPKRIMSAVVEHAELAAMVGESVPLRPTSQGSLLAPLQNHSSGIGFIKGRLSIGAPVIEGEVQRATKAMLIYLDNLKPSHGSDAYTVSQAVSSAPDLAPKFLEAAKGVSDVELTSVVAEFDKSFSKDGQNKWRLEFRRQFALNYYALTRDQRGATERLEALLPLINESTPEQQIDFLAAMVSAFAHVGDTSRARSVLAGIHDESLGYALAPKKDAQYVLWRDLLRLANATDPARRSQRVKTMLRQLCGLMETEGEAAGKRIASAVLTEAALAGAETGLSAARAMAEQGMLSWDGIVNALLLGMVTRRPDLADACLTTWCSLALPFYSEPHFRADQTGDFLDAAIAAACETEIARVIDYVRNAIETQSQSRVRVALLERLRNAALARGHEDQRLQDALSRWQSETPPEKERYTPAEFDDVVSFEELEGRLKSRSPDLSLYSASDAFARLIEKADFSQAVCQWERLPELHKEAKARFALSELAIAAGRSDIARPLLDEFIAQPNERTTWSYWTGADRLHYYELRIKLGDEETRKEAFSDLLGELAAGREYVQSLLTDAEDVFPIIAAAPDWPAMWDLLAEQLATTREFRLGKEQPPDEGGAGDEEVISALFRWAFSLQIPEVLRHARHGATHLLSAPKSAEIAKVLFEELLGGENDEPADALRILAASDATIHPGVKERVAALRSHPDYAVAVMASALARKWGLPATLSSAALPAFYNLHLQNDDEEGEAPRFSRSWGEDPLEWTQAFPVLVNSLARHVGSVTHIRRRCQMFIAEWGGTASFGKTALERLEAELRRLDMRLTYTKPQAIGVARGLRYVAGELRSAGLLTRRDEPWLLQMMGYAPQPLLAPAIRPKFLCRPASARGLWGKDAENWTKEVSSAVRIAHAEDFFVVGEWSRFATKDIRRKFGQERIRAPFLEAQELSDIDSILHEIPRAIWLGEVVPLYEEPSPYLLCRVMHGFKDAPDVSLSICPHWLARLRWRQSRSDPSAYLDATGGRVAQLIWWRDGGPTDIGEDVEWGEGFFFVVNQAGCQQLCSALTVPLEICTHAVRQTATDDERPVTEWASTTEFACAEYRGPASEL